MILFLSACATAPASRTAAIDPEPIEIMPAPAPAKAPPPAHVEAVTQTYRAAFAKERSQVMSDAATKDHIARIRAADRDAQAALARLRTTHGATQAQALTQARAAVGRLEAVLDDEP